MELLIERDDSQSFFVFKKYILNVILICTADELHLIDSHQLYKQHMFAVPELVERKQAAANAFKRSVDRPIFHSENAGKILADSMSAIYNAAKAQFSFVLTVRDAIEGFTIECPDLRELVQCEQQIVATFDELHQSLEDAQAFSMNREQVLAPDGAEDEDGPPPAAWANHQQWRYH